MTHKQLIRLFAATPAIAVLALSASCTSLAQAAHVPTIVVDDGGDTSSPCTVGSVTLRCAIDYANVPANAGTWIRFAPGLAAFLLQSALPTITRISTWIDGHDLNVGCVCPRIDASAALGWTGSSGLTINTSYVTISHIKVVNIPAGADRSIAGGKDLEISYDCLGILSSATQCGGPSLSTAGVEVANDRAGSAGSHDNGVAYIFANTISCHGGSGVEVVNSNYVYGGIERYDNTPFGSYTGTTSDGTRAAGNGYAGTRVAVKSDQIEIRANRIALNANDGVTADGGNVNVLYHTLCANYWALAISGGSTQLIVGNKIGTSVDDFLPLPNIHEGIFIAGGSGIAVTDNLVAYNGAAGIGATGNSTHASIQNNEFRSNGGLPIDLGYDGPTPNGAHFPPCPNDWLAYPVVTAFSGSLVQGIACANCAIYSFKSDGSPAARGGGTFLTNVLANGFGQWGATLPAGMTRWDMTLTASKAAYDTSEMSPLPKVFMPQIRR